MKLLGRDTELAALREACLRARDGRGQVVVVSGDAGLGKSALVDAIASELTSTFDVTWGRAWELADAPAYFPLWPCLKSLGIGADAAAGEAGTFELWEHVLEALVRASGKRSVLWAIEDLHVADTQTLDLLCFLAQAIRALPVVLLCTTRVQDPRLDERAQQRIVRLARDGREVRLAPLERPQIAALATHWLGREPSPAEIAQLAERTGGNPLFVIECARNAGKGLVDSVPPTVAVVVGERVALLPERAKRLVGDAAVLGNEVAAATLATMNEQLPARVIDDLAPALRAGILEELAPARYRFSHALVRDAIEAAMSNSVRSDAHARAERALAAQPDSPQRAVERARHALASLAMGRETLTVELVERAIAVLESQGTHDRAFALCRQLTDLRASGALPPVTASELARAGRIALAAGKYADSRELCLEAARLAREAGDHMALALAALALGAEIYPAQKHHALIQLLEEAIAKLGDQDSATHCRLTARLAAALQPAPDPTVPIAMAREAIARARAADDPALLDDVLFVAISTLTDFVDGTELRELNLEHLTLTRATDDTARTLRAFARLILAESELGHFHAANAHMEEMLSLANRVGHPRLTWRPLLLASMRAIARGQFAESDRYITEVERLAQLTDDPSLMLSLHAHRHQRSVDLHRENTVTQSFQLLEANLGQLPAAPSILPMLKGLAAARFGNADGVASALAGIDVQETLRYRTSPAPIGILGELCAMAGTREQRELMLARAQPFADRHIHFGQTPLAYGGPMRRVLGLLELSLGHREAGDEHLRSALQTCRDHGFATWVARISFELGEREEAARLANNLGIRGLAKRAHGSSVQPMSPPTMPSLGMWRDGDAWRISYGVRVARVPHSRGIELIAKLVERPGEEMHVLVLAGTGGEAITDSDAGEALDVRAAKSYRDRLGEVREEIERAEANADRGRLQQLSREREFLEGELARAFGLGDKARKVGSMSERARVNVQRRIKDSLARIGAQDNVIADYLRGAIRTGTYCTFRP